MRAQVFAAALLCSAYTTAVSFSPRDEDGFMVGARGGRARYPPQLLTGLPRETLADVTSGAVWPQPISVTTAVPGTWKQISVNEAAMSSDCPFLNHGPSDSLTNCQASCDSLPSCNVINFNAALPDCVLRNCADPYSPTLTPLPGYDVWAVQKQSLDINPVTFTLVATGYSDNLLMSALKRYHKWIFPYPASAAGGAQPRKPSGKLGNMLGLCVNVLSSDTTLDITTDESYNLTVLPDDVRGTAPQAFSSQLVANTVYGAMRGLETFSQLMQYNWTSGVYMIAATQIVDAPRFPYRAVMVDTSRHFLSVPVILNILDTMASVKMNVMHMHLTDDQSWPLVLTQYPNLTKISAFSQVAHTYSRSDIATIVQYAAERGIRVIPEIDTPAHTTAMTNAYPSVASIAYNQQNQSFLCLVDPSKESTFEFLTNVWSEVTSMFPDTSIFIGGDEVWGCWAMSPEVSKWMNASGYGVVEAYWYYERRLIDIARSLNRSVIAWEDINGFPADFPVNHSYNKYQDVTLTVWSGCYSGDWQSDVSLFTSQNASVIVSGPFYVTDQNGAPTSPHFTWQQMYSTDLWNFTGNTSQAMARVHGGLLAMWDDAADADSGDAYMELTPYIFGVSEAWWSPQAFTAAAVQGGGPDGMRAHQQRCRMIQRGLASHPIFGDPYANTFCPFEYEPVEVSPQ